MDANQYAEGRKGHWYVANSRVSLDSIIYAFRDGLSPEAISRECFPNLSLEQIYGAITFYLSRKNELDQYLRDQNEKFEEDRVAQQKGFPEFTEKMATARANLLASGQ